MSRTLGYSAMRIGDYRTCFHYLLNASKFDENRNKDYDLQISRECQSKIVDSASDYNRITYKYQSSETVDENSSLYIVALPAVIFLLILFQIFQRRKRKYRSD
jgi:nitrogen fixation/metabolism regulation signal transduction histidine kinase